MRFTYRRIVESLPVKKNSNSSWWVKLWVRKASFLFTYLFINLGFSSNAVSLLSVFVTLAACVCFGISTVPAIIAGIILINFWLVLDCVDGNIARCNKQKTTYGEFVDDMSGYFTTAFVYAAIGLAAFHNGGVLFSKGSEIILIAGAVSSISDVLARLIHKDYVCFGYEGGAENKEKVGTNLNENKKSLNYIRKRVGKEIGISGAFMPLTITCAITNSYDLMTIFYFLFNGFALASTTLLLFYKADKYDKTHKKG